MKTEPKNPDDFYKQKLTLLNLKAGDILTFEGEDNDLISSLIMKLTNSKVTHGALYFQDSPVQALADAGTTGLHAHEIADKETSRRAYVCRLTQPGSSDFFSDAEILPVMQAAKIYLDENLPYPYSDLLLLAMILVYKDISGVSIKQHVIIGILKIVSAEIKKLIDEKVHEGKHTMVCSSFVYQCYLDASKKDGRLKIALDNADIRGIRQANNVKTLFDLYAEHAAEYNFNENAFSVQENSGKEEKLEDLLKEALQDTDSEHVMLLKNNFLSNAIEDFLKTLLKFFGYTFSSIKELIENARELQSMFVTPNDLCFNIENAQKIGFVNLDRTSENLPSDKITTKYNINL